MLTRRGWGFGPALGHAASGAGVEQAKEQARYRTHLDAIALVGETECYCFYSKLFNIYLG